MKFILSILFIFLPSICNSQLLVSDKDGNSSILISGGGIGIDVTDSKLFANYYSPTVDENRRLMWGIALSGKNSSGIASLLNGEKFSPQSEALGTLGYYKIRKRYFDSEKNDISSKIINKYKERSKNDSMKIECGAKIRALRLDTIVAKITIIGADSIANQLSKIIDNSRFYKLIEKVEAISKKFRKKINDSKNLALKKQFDTLFFLLKSNKKILLKFDSLHLNSQVLKKEQREIDGKVSKTKFSKTIFYVRGGFSSLGFKYDLQNTAGNFPDRFEDTLNTFGTIEVGLTRRSKRGFWGSSFRVNRTSSFPLLDKGSYTQIVIDSSLNDGLLRTEKEVTAYSGNYFQATQYMFSIDCLHLALVNKNNKQYIGVGAFFRRSWFSDENEEERLRDVANFGFHVSLIDGKKGRFIGGVYLQNSDLFNETAQRRKKSFSFGLTTQYAFGVNLKSKTKGSPATPVI